jgi:hypothetical protein
MDIPPGFRGVEVEPTVRGNAVPMRVENESMTSRLVFGAG